MRSISLLLLTAALAGCATPPPPAARTAEAQAKLQQLIGGRAPGQAVGCLPSYSARDMRVIDDNTIAFRSGGDLYVNDLSAGGCTQLGSGFYTLVTRSSGGSLCSGDIAQVMDVSTGMTVGSCALGDFIPYRRT